MSAGVPAKRSPALQHRQHRYPTQYPIDILTPQGQQQGRVIDVNKGGARILGLRQLVRGDKVTITVLSHRIDAVVCWAEADRVGLMFRPRLTEHQLDTIRYRQDPRAPARNWSEGMHLREM